MLYQASSRVPVLNGKRTNEIFSSEKLTYAIYQAAYDPEGIEVVYRSDSDLLVRLTLRCGKGEAEGGKLSWTVLEGRLRRPVVQKSIDMLEHRLHSVELAVSPDATGAVRIVSDQKAVRCDVTVAARAISKQ